MTEVRPAAGETRPRESTGPTGPGQWGWLVAWLAVAAMGVLALTQAVGFGLIGPLPVIQSLTPWLLLPAFPVAVLAAFMLTALIGVLAFCIDLGYLMVERSQLQRTADAAAMAAAWELADEGLFKGDQYMSLAISDARNMARLLALGNPKIKNVKMEDVVDNTPFERLERSAFYREIVAPVKK